ncbi:archaeosortase/exosortase family protein [Hymenobacter sp. RP-2-7]|uniref:Archaeosortase/exosortase family protein n=1 Tax=Hymenobacter polaris TaxID=2682546 RepID=A0A7Y0FKV8_9BACT|nr:exosortase/archaeosortase family protein [Hymenobacter polaris]NML64123.1 archaeosortase/exosortase family protein [Hymenobacter polaris]
MPASSISANRPLLYFTVVAVSLYLLWFFGYEKYLEPDGRLDAFLTHNIASASAMILRWLGFAATVPSTQPNMILLANVPTVVIGPYCDGMVLYALFSGFILAFPSGTAGRKLWFIVLGNILIYAVNIGRIIALCLNHHYSHKTVEFNHHYTFAVIEYSFIFLLWIWWSSRLALPGRSAGHSAPAAQQVYG